jgi:hypothetical protein
MQHHTLGEAQRLIAHSLCVEEALGLAQLKAVEISTAQSGKWDDLLEDAVQKQRCAAPRAFEQRLTILIKYLKSATDGPERLLRDLEAEGLAMLAAAEICSTAPDRWIDCAKEAVRKADVPDPASFEKKLIFRLMYLKDLRESALSSAGFARRSSPSLPDRRTG